MNSNQLPIEDIMQSHVSEKDSVTSDLNNTELDKGSLSDAGESETFSLAGSTSEPVTQTDFNSNDAGTGSNTAWIKQFGTSSWDSTTDIATDNAGNVYISGDTNGTLGSSSAGENDVWVAKYSAEGNQLWLKQFGTETTEQCFGFTSDSTGNVYLTGYTRGAWGSPKAGSYIFDEDAFVAKYDSQGNQIWVQQFGNALPQYSQDVATDSTGNLYVSGETYGDLGGSSAGFVDAWVAKYDSTGNQLWVKQWGTAGADSAQNVGVDGAGNVYICGDTQGDLGGQYNTYIAKYDSTGNQLWVKQLGAASDYRREDFKTDSAGNLYISGRASGTDAWAAKYDSEGNQVWSHQWGTADYDYANGIALDDAGNVYVSGGTGEPAIFDSPNADPWVIKYDAEGNQQWVKALNTPGRDTSSGVAVNGAGNIYTAGNIFDDSEMPDVWVAQLSLNPPGGGEPPDGNDTLTGNAGHDLLVGTAGHDSLYGGMGMDTLDGLEGHDLLDGGSDHDLLDGGAGHDTLNGGTGHDTLNGGAGKDTLDGGAGDDWLNGGSGKDVLIGCDSLATSPGVGELDTLTGGSGSDRFILGDAGKGAYYNDGNSSNSGSADFALLRSFKLSEDFIQLAGSATDYILSSVGTCTNIYLDNDGTSGLSSKDELIAKVAGLTGLNLTESYFVYS
ncbi:MAG: SBBP repeat-containing protein [Microcoleus vaginatus WJT46-NPBG5]|jgi:hypothetical protein|nr:SBBP repeat-containing protein [Microcoleus vaginatus WJT46-NPBG5]